MKILTIDIETYPLEAWVWGIWDVNIGIDAIKTPGGLLCFSAKWLGDNKTMFFRGENMLEEAWYLMDQADAIIHYNGKKFDVPHLDTEFFIRSISPPSPFVQIDLCNVIKKRFKFPSNKLNYVSQAIGIGEKTPHNGMPLWVSCMKGDPKAWKLMEKYNRQDVVLTEKLYERLLPWIPGHPNRQLYDDIVGCPTCGSDSIQRRGFYRTRVSEYQQYWCTDCGSWFRGNARLRGTPLTGATL